MTLMTRIARLFKADLHGILDNLEEPETLLKQAVRDMQEEIDQAEADLASLNKQQERLRQKQQHLTGQIEEQKQQLSFCLREDNENLAKSVIRKKLQAELSLKELSGQLKNIGEEIAKKNAETDERKEKLQTIRDKLELFCEQHDNAYENEASAGVSQDDVELAYLSEKQRHAQQQGEQS